MAPEEMDEATGRVFFANLENGDTVTNPVYVEFGVEGMEVRPAGEIVEGTGHHHLLIGNAFLQKGRLFLQMKTTFTTAVDKLQIQ